MFCGKCGNKLDDKSAFCGKCGAAVNGMMPKNNNDKDSSHIDGVNSEKRLTHSFFAMMDNAIMEDSVNEVDENQEDYIFCTKCGSRVESGLSFCNACGTPLPNRMYIKKIVDHNNDLGISDIIVKDIFIGNIKINYKNIIRAFSIVLVALFFIPTFLVSCGSDTKKVSAAEIMVGVKDKTNGNIQELSDPKPLLLFLLILPVVVFLIWYIKGEYYKRIASGVAFICSLIELIAWNRLKEGVEEYVKQNYCEYSTMGGFTWVRISSIIVMLLSAAIFIGLLDDDSLNIRFRRERKD